MPTPSEQLLSRTIYDIDGVTTVWDFSFSGGYLDPTHVKAYTELPNKVRTELTVIPAQLIGEFQLQITPALSAAEGILVIYRDTPKNLPLVDFVDGPLSEVALDTNAKQAVFIAAEAMDSVNAVDGTAIVQAVNLIAEQAAASAAAAATLGVVTGATPVLGSILNITAGITIDTGLVVGGVYLIINQTAGNLTLTQGAGLTMTLEGATLTGNRVLLPKSLAVILPLTSSSYYILGGGVA